MLASLVIFLQVHFFSNCYETNNYKELFKNKVIFISGGTGFIGNALIEKILEYNPLKIIIFSRDELKHAKLLEKFNDDRLESIIGDVRNSISLLNATKNVDIVIHAAALKRIDLMEHNVIESILTNIIGSLNVLQASISNNVGKTLLVSTDKACLPVNTYGACKYISEKLFANYAPKKSNNQFMIVRYGNVLESTGSVIPYFIEKINANLPIPLTDIKMTRFIISKDQAIELIFKALLYGSKGEIFVPQLPSCKITDLIMVLQKKFNDTSPINLIGLRPGEKIHEILISNTEIPRAYQFKDIYIIAPSIKHVHQNIYSKEGIPLDPDNFNEYSSATSLISKETLGKLLEKECSIFL